jgi:hypothetical protein
MQLITEAVLPSLGTVGRELRPEDTLACDPAASFDGPNRFVPMFRSMASTATHRLVGFVRADVTLANCGLTLTRYRQQVMPSDASTIFYDGPGTDAGDVSELLSAAATLAHAGITLLAPAVVR